MPRVYAIKQHIKRVFLTIGIVLAFAACGTNVNNAIETSVNGEFSTIEIKNPYAENIIIQKIGYEINGDTSWLTSKPVKEVHTNSELTLFWPNYPLTIRVLKKNHTYTFSVTSEKFVPNKWFVSIKAKETEYFTGVFERVVDGKQDASWANGLKTGLNLRGEKMDVVLKPTVSAYAPFYLSSNNYGLFVQGTWPGHFDFCHTRNDEVQFWFEGPSLNLKLYTAEEPLTIVQKHALETGPSIVPPKWAFGPWRWRDQHFNKKCYYDKTVKKAPYNTDIVEDVLMMEALDIPATAHWIDRPWAPGTSGFNDYTFDLNEFPNPEGMIQWINSKNQELMMWIAPFVMGDMAEYAKEHNYHLKSKKWFNSQAVLMDFTNTEAVKWWGENGPGKLAKMGIKGFKLDRADGEKLTDSIQLSTQKGTTYRENYNDYPHQYVQATYQAVQPILGDDFILFPRAQYTGSAKYGAMWAGDTDGKAEGLRSAVIAMQRCAIMGYPIWGSDIGGYWGEFSRETTMRWIGFGCFSPIMETGPTNNLGFWSNPSEPYYDIELLATWRLYAKLRMKLVDYLEEQAKIASKTGTPIASPLFLKYPEQQKAWNDWQTYLLGPDILVSAIWINEETIHQVYLPEGEIWIDAWNTSKRYEGGQTIKVKAPLYKIPVFIRAGAAIQLGDLKALYQESLKKVSEKPDLTKLERKEGWR